MKSIFTRAALLALALCITPAGIALAGDEDVTANSGDAGIWAEDANQGRGVQNNADDWQNMDNALAGNGAQNADTDGNANTGTGFQDNTETYQDEWYGIDNANSGRGAQVLDSTNTNGGDRISNDTLVDAGDTVSLANADLEAAVSGNSVAVAGSGGNADSGMSIYGDSRFSGLSGVSAIALGSGGNASQNVSINVTAAVQ
jgi:hypothetical protein